MAKKHETNLTAPGTPATMPAETTSGAAADNEDKRSITTEPDTFSPPSDASSMAIKVGSIVPPEPVLGFSTPFTRIAHEVVMAIAEDKPITGIMGRINEEMPASKSEAQGLVARMDRLRTAFDRVSTMAVEAFWAKHR